MKFPVALALFGFTSCQVFAAEESPPNVRFIKEQVGDVLTVTVKSDYLTEFTVTLEATMENVTPSRPVPFTVESAGRRSFQLVRFQRTDKRRAWSCHYQPFCQFGARRSTTTNDADYSMPFGPGRYVVMQGPRGSFSHFAGTGSENAVDWTVPVGTVVCAARDGRVVGVKQDSNVGGPDPSFRPYANYIIIKHSDGTFAEYIHLQKDGALVQLGDQVTVGQPIGLSGQTGFASKPHLHFDVFQAIDGKRKLSLPFRLKTSRGIFTEFVTGREY
ncbi:MAG: M23 family metallopeptidase [Chthoniobacterales bacterium]